MGSILGPNRVKGKVVKSLLLCQMRNIDILVGGLPWPQPGATHYHAQLTLLDKGLIVCYVVWLGSMKGMGLRTSTGLDKYGPLL